MFQLTTVSGASARGGAAIAAGSPATAWISASVSRGSLKYPSRRSTERSATVTAIVFRIMISFHSCRLQPILRRPGGASCDEDNPDRAPDQGPHAPSERKTEPVRCAQAQHVRKRGGGCFRHAEFSGDELAGAVQQPSRALEDNDRGQRRLSAEPREHDVRLE